MVLQQSGSCLPCFGGESSRCYPPPRCYPQYPCRPCSAMSTQMEKLVGTIQGFEDPRKKKGAGAGGAGGAGGKGGKCDEPTCCCKAPCTLISSLLRKLKSTESPSQRKSLTCVIFSELCKLSGTDPSLQDDVKRNTALALAQKFGAWIDEMLEKKGTITCPAMEIDQQTQDILGDIFDCTCCVPKKEYPERNPKCDKGDGKGKKGKGGDGSKKGKGKGKKKKGKGDKGKKDAEREAREREEEAARLAKLAAEEEAARLAKLAEEAAAKAAAEAAAAAERARQLAACKEAAAKKKLAMQEAMMKEKEDSDKLEKEQREKCLKAKAEAEKQKAAREAEKKKTDQGGLGKGGGGSKTTAPLCGPKTIVPSNMKQCSCSAGKSKPTLSSLLCGDQSVCKGMSDQTLDNGNSSNVVEQYSKIVQHFLGTLDDMNDWIQNIVKETDQVIGGRLDSNSHTNIMNEVEQDWKIFKNKMYLKTHHWKYFNKVAKKMVSQIQDQCACEVRAGCCTCPNRMCISQTPTRPCCGGNSIKAYNEANNEMSYVDPASFNCY